MITKEALERFYRELEMMKRRQDFERRQREIVEEALRPNRGILGHRLADGSVIICVPDNQYLVYVELEKKTRESVPLDNGRHLIRYPRSLLGDTPLIYGMPLRYNVKDQLEVDKDLATQRMDYTDKPLLINRLQKAD